MSIENKKFAAGVSVFRNDGTWRDYYTVYVNPVIMRQNPCKPDGRVAFYIKVGKSGKVYTELCPGQELLQVTADPRKEPEADEAEITDEEIVF